ncbi:MAG: uroporphyrinogen decarboxylase family protein [bacterium]
MNSKERVFKAIDREEADRVPIDYWGTAEVGEKLKKHLGAKDQEELLQKLDCDLRYIPGPLYIGPELRKYPDGGSEDLWGVVRKTKYIDESEERGSYEHVVRSPLAEMKTVGEIENYARWPSPDWFDYSAIEGQCDAHPDRAVVFMGDRLNRTAQFKPAQYLRGMDRFMIDMVESPALAEAIIERIVDFYLQYDERIFRAAGGKIDIFLMGDDFGMQTGMIVSPDMWRRFFAPGLGKFIGLAKKYGIKVMHHSCGSIRPIIPDLIEMGLDILNPIQPGTTGMDPVELKREFGRYICFHGGVSIQRNLPFGTPEDVRAEVRELMRSLAPGGGFIICTAHNIQPDTPVENVLALFEAYREYGSYSIP